MFLISESATRAELNNPYADKLSATTLLNNGQLTINFNIPESFTVESAKNIETIDNSGIENMAASQFGQDFSDQRENADSEYGSPVDFDSDNLESQDNTNTQTGISATTGADEPSGIDTSTMADPKELSGEDADSESSEVDGQTTDTNIKASEEGTAQQEISHSEL